jgi:hypothetical protein
MKSSVERNLMTDGKGITIDCPVCEEETTITEKEIRMAIQHRGSTGGKILVFCDQCCRALVLPEDVPTDGAALEQWITAEEENPDDCCECVPMLDRNQEITPNGGYADLNLWYYRPGNGKTPLPERRYRYTYGISPKCYQAKNPSMGGTPTRVGKSPARKVGK